MNFQEMLKSQDNLNCKLDPQWKTRSDWSHREAMLVEIAECLVSLGYAWWKPDEMDIENAKLELVDIWHFMLNEANVNPQYRYNLTNAVNNPTFDTTMDIAAARRTLANFATSNFMPHMFFVTCGYVGMSYEELSLRYARKATLNRFRWDNGYANGTYIKIWDGREDNAVLMTDLADVPVEQLYHALTDAYALVKANG